MSTSAQPNELRISIEMGDAYQPTDRLRAALDELGQALAEADAAEVQGFGKGPELGSFSIAGFRTLSYANVDGNVHSRTIAPKFVEGGPTPEFKWE